MKTGSREAVIYTKKVLGIRYLRVWNIFEKEMYIVQNREMGSARFKLLDEALGVLVENDILPVIEIGEKPRRILNSVNDFLRESENVTLFQDYQEFLRCFADMMEHVVRNLGRRRFHNGSSSCGMTSAWRYMRISSRIRSCSAT